MVASRTGALAIIRADQVSQHFDRERDAVIDIALLNTLVPNLLAVPTFPAKRVSLVTPTHITGKNVDAGEQFPIVGLSNRQILYLNWGCGNTSLLLCII